MDFKIAITCNVCKCGFELRPEHFKLRDRLECPNCGQELPAEFYSNLKTGVVALVKSLSSGGGPSPLQAAFQLVGTKGPFPQATYKSDGEFRFSLLQEYWPAPFQAYYRRLKPQLPVCSPFSHLAFCPALSNDLEL